MTTAAGDTSRARERFAVLRGRGFDSRYALVASLLAAIVLAFVVGHVAGYRSVDMNVSDAPKSLFECIDDAEKGFAGTDPVLRRSHAIDVCYRTFHGFHVLNDFRIRRLKFVQQQYDEVIMLWMVVLITVSGVALAGLQLAASYKLASQAGQSSLGEPSEITVERDRLVFKSSVTGLAILVISFAFFLVFVLEIYTIKEIRNASVQVSGDAPHADGTAPAAGYGEPSAASPN